MINRFNMSVSNNKPELRFNEFSANWNRTKLGNTAKTFSGGTPSSTKKEYYSGDIAFIKSGEITSTSTEQNVSEKALLESSAKMVNEGDLLYALYGATSGSVAISKIQGAINQAVLCIRTEQDKEFLYQYLSYNKPKILAKYLQGGQGNLSADIVKKLSVVFPEPEEQKKIAEFLGVVDEWIKNLKKQKAKLEEYKKGMMQKIFSQAVRFEDDDGKGFPDWEEKKLGDVVNFLSDYTANGSFAALKENVKYYSSNNYAALVRTTDLEKDIFAPERFTDKRGYDFLKKTSLQGGELIMSNVGYIGKVYKVPKHDGHMTLAPNTYVIGFEPNTEQEFMYQWMTTREFKKKVLTMVGGGGLTAINKTSFRSIKTNRPSLKEQQKIAGFLSSLDGLIDAKSGKIEKAETWKKGLLQKMFV